jgi:hypothetical protein
MSAAAAAAAELLAPSKSSLPLGRSKQIGSPALIVYFYVGH